MFVHTNINLPPTSHLASYKAAPSASLQAGVSSRSHPVPPHPVPPSQDQQLWIFRAPLSSRERTRYTDRAASEERSIPARLQQISFCVSRYGGLAARDDDLLAFKVGNENRASERVITMRMSTCVCLRFPTPDSESSSCPTGKTGCIYEGDGVTHL